MGVLKGGDVLFIGAHSGVGKTSLAKNIAVHIASKPGRQCASMVQDENGEYRQCSATMFGEEKDGVRCDICGGEESIKVEHHVAFFSPEMTEEELHDSIVFSEAQAKMPFVDFNGRTHISEDAFRKVGEKALYLAKLPIKIFCDSSVRYMSNVRLKCLAYKRKLERSMVCDRCGAEGPGQGQCRCGSWAWKRRRLAAFVVDYVQLMKPGGPDQRKSQSREQEVAAVGRLVKELAKETKAVGIDLGQLNKDSKKEKRKPILDDIRESSSPGYDANKAILIYNPSAAERVHEYADTAPDKEGFDCVDLIIAKCRGGGRTGIVRCAFYSQWTLFADWPEGVPMPDNEAPSGEEKHQRRR
jgi:replicative DNA helicase